MIVDDENFTPDGAKSGGSTIEAAEEVCFSFYVERAVGRWEIRFNGKCYEYNTREGAIREAVDTARKICHLGVNSRVFILADNNRWTLVWSSEDPSIDPLTPA